MKTWLKNIGLILLISLVFAGTAWFLPNELNFKIQNFRGKFAQAKQVFPQWKLLAENNELGKAYEQKNYSAVKKNLAKILENECLLDQKVIPEVCENIFYLAGITDYRLGEKLSLQKQKPLFEKAIYEFEKVLALNPQNTWAKENIAFILKKLAEKQQAEKQKQQQNQQNKDQKNGDKSQNSQDQKGNSGQKNKEDQKSGKGQNKQDQPDQKSGKQNSENSSAQNKSDNSSAENKENPAKNSDNSQDKQGQSGKNKQDSSDQKQGENPAKSDSQTGSSDQEKSNQPAPSRLPQNIERALEQVQRDLEQNQDQRGFNRSRSAAEKDKNSRDFFNDPFFDDFFGNDPFFNNFFGGGQKHFHKNIADPNEKDW